MPLIAERVTSNDSNTDAKEEQSNMESDSAVLVCAVGTDEAGTEAKVCEELFGDIVEHCLSIASNDSCCNLVLLYL